MIDPFQVVAIVKELQSKSAQCSANAKIAEEAGESLTWVTELRGMAIGYQRAAELVEYLLPNEEGTTFHHDDHLKGSDGV